MEILGRAILIRPDTLPERTESGNLIIPENSVEMLPEWGEVIGAGPACRMVRVGMRVKFIRRGASVMVLDGEDLYITTENPAKISYMREPEKKKI